MKMGKLKVTSLRLTLHIFAINDNFIYFTNAQKVSVATKDGSTCAHIAASKGSVSVIEELMKFDKNFVISSRNKLTDSTPLHIATEGGHFDVVKLLLDNGAQAADENKESHLKNSKYSVHYLTELLIIESADYCC